MGDFGGMSGRDGDDGDSEFTAACFLLFFTAATSLVVPAKPSPRIVFRLVKFAPSVAADDCFAGGLVGVEGRGERGAPLDFAGDEEGEEGDLGTMIEAEIFSNLEGEIGEAGRGVRSEGERREPEEEGPPGEGGGKTKVGES